MEFARQIIITVWFLGSPDPIIIPETFSQPVPMEQCQQYGNQVVEEALLALMNQAEQFRRQGIPAEEVKEVRYTCR